MSLQSRWTNRAKRTPHVFPPRPPAPSPWKTRPAKPLDVLTLPPHHEQHPNNDADKRAQVSEAQGQ